MPCSPSSSSSSGSDVAAPVIEARDLVTEIGGRRIHDGLDLRIERGELMAIAGSSGSGKTVLIRA
ncbi:ATP-binding cassette domain-containing protein, partial [Arhodomonas sp. KWT]|uniref:ATP-binding cassette domain-containing protein n=1 Tax=Arhodomonas sp. KWT TaxID=2679915 RepID=UPI0035303534